MAPTPEAVHVPPPSNGNEIVISGMSGRFPKSSSIKEFADNLYNKVDMLQPPTQRWEFSHPEMSPFIGICPDMEKFDAQFFAIHYKQSASMDPTIRKLLECACEAVIDAGMNPKSLRNTNTGVFMASSISESEKNLNYDSSTISGYGLTGSSRSMMGNRISFWLGTTGPSYSSDNACCGGALALQQAYQAMSQGYCETAVVGSSTLCLEPCLNLHFRWMDLLTLETKTKSLDQDANGYNRSDSIVVFLLQKAKNAKRVYAELVHTKTIYTGIREVDHTFQMLNPENFGKFLIDFYNEIDVKPEEIEYLEACGTGVYEADHQELKKIDEIFCTKNRRTPIKVGSIKSNMGHCEASSPLVALVKLCLGYSRCEIAGNLHLENQCNVAGIKEGRIKLLDDHCAFNRGYSAINTYSYIGVNSHILLKHYDNAKAASKKLSDIPYLICVSSRNEDTLKTTFDEIESKPLDPRQIALVTNVYSSEVPGFLMRGYKIYNSTHEDKPQSLAANSAYFDGAQRPIWFVYSGMGSQWPTMGAQLMRFPVFAAAVDRCCNILRPKNLDLMKLLNDPDPEMFSNILHSFVAIAAVQIGLTDLLHSLGITPDNIIGHSVGELGCAYADGCLSAEEMILSAYYRGLVSLESPLIKGSMAAVGLGYSTIRSFCPPEVDVACHNGHDSSTVSGPVDILKAFVSELTKRGIFAKEVACSSIAYHSRYIAPAGSGLKNYLLQVIKEPKLRSARWISSSVPQGRWDESSAKFCSAEYLTNNLLNPVLFEEASRLIPENAITIEIAPHGLLQAILKRSLSSNCVNVSLTRRGHKDNVQHVLNAIGQLYVAGLYPKLETLYPQVQFPVPADTPLMSHTLSWMHDEVWPVGCGRRPAPLNTGEYHHVLSTKDCDHEYLTGHYINGVNVYPAAAQLVLIWETLAMVLGVKYTTLGVIFQNVRFNSDIVIPKDEPLELSVFLQQGSKNFEITNQGVAVTTGQIIVTKDFSERLLEEDESDNVILNSNDIYRMFSLRGHNYSGEFGIIKSIDGTFTKAKIDFRDNWVTFLDALIQFSIINKNNTGVTTPKRIETLEINLNKFNNIIENLKRNEYLNALMFNKHDIIRCAGVEMKGLVTENYKNTNNNDYVLQKYVFFPYDTTAKQATEAMKVNIQTVLENLNKNEITVVEIEDCVKIALKQEIHSLVKEIYLQNTIVNVMSVSLEEVSANNANILKEADLIIVNDFSDYKNAKTDILKKIDANCFVLSIEDVNVNEVSISDFKTLSKIITEEKAYYLLRQPMNIINLKIVAADKLDQSVIVNYIENNVSNDNILLLARKAKHKLIGTVKSLRSNFNSNRVQLLFIDDNNAPPFDPKLPLYQKQIQKGLAVNVFKNSSWGSYRYINFEEARIKTQHTELSITTKTGDNLQWVEASPIGTSNKILVKVHYARISCSELIKVKGRKNMTSDDVLDRTFGMSFSGTTKSGERVMGLVKNNPIASVIEADPELLWPVPSYWTLIEAATVPRAYVQALYYLFDKSINLCQNKSVLVTSGAGALGQALINVCLNSGCRVFVTVDNSSKKRMLLKMFPQLGDNNICLSEDTLLLQMIAEGTGGLGCDVIISSVSRDKRLVVMNCLTSFSSYIDIGVDDMEDNASFGLSFVRDERGYLAANFASVFAPNQSPLRKTLRKAIYDGIQAGWVKPLSRVVFDSHDVSRAFRFLSGRRNHGAVLLKLRDFSSPTLRFDAIANWKCDANGIHVVVCDKEALGVEIADKLVQLGAKNLVINTEHVNGYLQYKIKKWAQSNVNITLSRTDLTSVESSSSLLSNASKMGNISSIFVAITSTNNYVTIQYLDVASRQYNLSKFVVINASQRDDNDIETICEDRLNADLPATKIKVILSQNHSQTEKPPKIEEWATSINVATNDLNFILAQNESSIVVLPKRNKTRNLSEIISNALDIMSIEKLNEALTIEDLDIGEDIVNELSNVLVDSYNISYNTNDILNLTLKEIKKLDDKKLTCIENQNCGFNLFFRHYETDNLFVSDPFIWMPTVISDGDNRVDFYKGEDYLIVLPGMDGHRHSMYRLCRRLRLRAVLCQYPIELKPDSVQELAELYARIIKTKIAIGSKFYILGYSFGALVALEMALIFEKSGMKGKVFFLDGSPLLMHTLLEYEIKSMSVEQQQNLLLSHMYQIMSKQCDNILPYLEKETDWSKKVTVCIKLLKNHIEEPFEFQRLILETAYKRLIMAINYKRSEGKISSDLILMRAQGSSLPKDYGLGEITTKPVNVYHLDSNHISAPYDLRCSDIINRELNLDKSSIDETVARLNKLNSSIDGRMIR